MSLEKITVEIEWWYNSSSTNAKGCHFRFPSSRLPILLNPKPHSSHHFETVHIQVQKKTFLSSTWLLREIRKIENIEKKIASVNEKKNIAYERKWEKIEDKLP